MDDFSAHFAAQGQTQQQQAPDARSIDSDRLDIIYNDNENPGRIVTHAPKERFRLGYFDVMCLVINFMIGTFGQGFTGVEEAQGYGPFQKSQTLSLETA